MRAVLPNLRHAATLNSSSMPFWRRASKPNQEAGALLLTSQSAAKHAAAGAARKAMQRVPYPGQLTAAFACGCLASALAICLLAWAGHSPLLLKTLPAGHSEAQAVAPLPPCAGAAEHAEPEEVQQRNRSAGWQDHLIIAARHSEVRCGVACTSGTDVCRCMRAIRCTSLLPYVGLLRLVSAASCCC